MPRAYGWPLGAESSGIFWLVWQRDILGPPCGARIRSHRLIDSRHGLNRGGADQSVPGVNSIRSNALIHEGPAPLSLDDGRPTLLVPKS
jgi:hypothetical protein